MPVSAPPIAVVFGEAVLETPQDLFIPPDALRVILESFEGPLDLLLYLIRKQNLDVLDIPMARITAQYMEYIDGMRDARLELAAEYLLMAALLIEIKSRMLLPRPPAELADELEDPRAELVRRLLEYEQIKLAALELDRIPQAERDFAWLAVLVEQSAEKRLPELTVVDIRQAWLAILARAKNNRRHEIQQDELSVREQMSAILRVLAFKPFVPFDELFDPTLGVRHVVVNFIAMLELAKEGLVLISQDEAYAPIYVRQAMVPRREPATGEA
ncbi:segregation/condensation protein A [Laribacter hongkongensis]|nr:segregation/condensation protein A [Laribacter hongkongensis]MCG8993883.1 segregation/condensation protein A [Laribacter hongkongensis]MCG9009804.1 segregation/condensation protein A [Laribacter hongkongensis]MCG9021712.1 segregation/condensation protein A [Laribacter hongkongensis]MCG9025931.1 segregation/condensation protein A [Laribacter hongkongensis]MCG9046033.1 segregation/condensation protein A [Laribacter hongkongensis]